jgi:hypothetical protein
LHWLGGFRISACFSHRAIEAALYYIVTRKARKKGTSFFEVGLV